MSHGNWAWFAGLHIDGRRKRIIQLQNILYNNIICVRQFCATPQRIRLKSISLTTYRNKKYSRPKNRTNGLDCMLSFYICMSTSMYLYAALADRWW